MPAGSIEPTGKKYAFISVVEEHAEALIGHVYVKLSGYLIGRMHAKNRNADVYNVNSEVGYVCRNRSASAEVNSSKFTCQMTLFALKMFLTYDMNSA